MPESGRKRAEESRALGWFLTQRCCFGDLLLLQTALLCRGEPWQLSSRRCVPTLPQRELANLATGMQLWLPHLVPQGLGISLSC